MSEAVRAYVPPLACDRVIGQFRFEDGSMIAIVAAGKMDTATLLEFAEEMIASKRRELGRIAAKKIPADFIPIGA